MGGDGGRGRGCGARGHAVLTGQRKGSNAESTWRQRERNTQLASHSLTHRYSLSHRH